MSRTPREHAGCPAGPQSACTVLTSFFASALLLGFVACGPTEAPEPVPRSGLCLNGVYTGARAANALELLERRYPRRISDWLDMREPGPLVLVDGTPVDGLQRLASLDPAVIASVELLEADRSVPEYGGRARAGAVVVVTKPGLEEGVDRQAGARPVTACRRRN